MRSSSLSAVFLKAQTQKRLRPTVLAFALACYHGLAALEAADAVSFNRQVRPLLSDRCFHCHGPDEASRKGKLRLDVRADAVREVIVPGASASSELVARITSSREEDRMPPSDSGVKALSEEEILLLRRWVDEGAVFERHWAFQPIRRPALPSVTDERWVRNPIDRFVLARLEQGQRGPNHEASPRALLRRLSLDLVGLPPNRQQLAGFERALSSDSERAYSQQVDGLLASKRYGERMAMVWLDAARYADTDGFQADATRSNWAWRDWVIEAYNRNLPFDQFTREQFSGDLLPDATPEQILATCFHRNHMANGEGGRDPEESRIDYVIDRVNTMGTVWLGLTLGCAQCHNHKFDPVSQKEYYQLNAFFNSVDEDGRAGGGAKPFLEYRSPFVGAGLQEARLWLGAKESEFDAATRTARQAFEDWLLRLPEAIGEGYRSWSPLSFSRMATTSESSIDRGDDEDVVISGVNPRHDDYVLHARSPGKRITGIRLEVLPRESGKGYSDSEDGHVILTNVKFGVQSPGQSQFEEIDVRGARADYENEKKGARDYGQFRDVLDDDPRTGWTTNGSDVTQPRVGVFEFVEPVTLDAAEELVVELRHRSLKGFGSIRRLRLSATSEAGPAVREVGVTPREAWASTKSQGLPSALRDRLWDEFVEDQGEYQRSRSARDAAVDRVESYVKANQVQKVMVLGERERARETHVLLRGVWDQKGDSVEPGFLSLLGKDSGGKKLTRRELADWLMDPENPLTARVTVNRYWQMYFGHGLVRTPEDFGRQGNPPTHPQLLDWLAAEFIESGWDIKQLQRLMVTSATYRQSSDASASLIQEDPENRLLARATRFRMPSWMIRDAALSTSGLLVHRLGGPPVYPHQPPGLWADSTMGRFHYRASVGQDLYRRSLYGFWRRSVGPALMFDASKRRVCQVRVTRTSTPLQALTLMNDRTFIEAGCHMALSDQRGGKPSIPSLFEAVLSRRATELELTELNAQFDEALSYYQRHPEAGHALLSGQPLSSRVELTPGRAALAIIGMTLLNLDEAITRQ